MQMGDGEGRSPEGAGDSFLLDCLINEYFETALTYFNCLTKEKMQFLIVKGKELQALGAKESKTRCTHQETSWDEIKKTRQDLIIFIIIQFCRESLASGDFVNNDSGDVPKTEITDQLQGIISGHEENFTKPATTPGQSTSRNQGGDRSGSEKSIPNIIRELERITSSYKQQRTEQSENSNFRTEDNSSNTEEVIQDPNFPRTTEHISTENISCLPSTSKDSPTTYSTGKSAIDSPMQNLLKGHCDVLEGVGSGPSELESEDSSWSGPNKLPTPPIRRRRRSKIVDEREEPPEDTTTAQAITSCLVVSYLKLNEISLESKRLQNAISILESTNVDEDSVSTIHLSIQKSSQELKQKEEQIDRLNIQKSTLEEEINAMLTKRGAIREELDRLHHLIREKTSKRPKKALTGVRKFFSSLF